jgi:hypothetical protein
MQRSSYGNVSIATITHRPSLYSAGLGAWTSQTSLYSRHYIRKDQPAFSGAAEPSFVARMEVGFSQFLFGSCSAFG